MFKSSQFRYAATYIIVTFLVLMFFNFFSSQLSLHLFSVGKESGMMQNCESAAQQLGQLNELNKYSIAREINSDIRGIIVTDNKGIVVYHGSDPSACGRPLLVPEVERALNRNRVFNSEYRGGVIYSYAAMPVYSGITVTGCVYIAEEDVTQGSLLGAFQQYMLIISIILGLAVIVFSIIYSRKYSDRLLKITSSMRTVREGNYSEGVDIGGNDELTVLGDEFNGLISRLQTSERKRNNFVSDASHELKTPLASIKLLSDSILQNDMDVETIREFVGDIGKEADRLTRMSEKLLSLSRIEGQADSDCEIVYMAPAIQRVIRMLSRFAEQKDITFDVDLSNDCTILILEDDLYEIVFNLVDNAIKYNVQSGRVYISLKREEDNAILKIRDTGVGIPEEAQKHVFERFFRVDKARSRKSGGSGLGLAIVMNMVERNQGTIEMESVLGEGTTFTLTFPAFDTDLQEE